MATKLDYEVPPPLPKRPALARKPLPSPNYAKENQALEVGNVEDKLSKEAGDEFEHEQELYELEIEGLDLGGDGETEDELVESLAELRSTSTTQSDTPSTASTASSRWKTAIDATKHFAGGLITHPVQSTKRYSILRHSHGLAIYQGTSTNVAITLFADDQNIPLDRTVWLQQKGWTGNRGMRLKTALGYNDDWLDVTPQACINALELKPADEKAWQRDIAKFLRKAAEDKKFRRRRPVETLIVRIPYASQDGYFRLVVCTDQGRRVLCPSPVFRIASLGTDSASFKGASLSTMPLEIGIKALTVFATDTALATVAPVAGAIQNRFGRYMPGIVTQQVVTTAYGASGLQGKVDTINEQFGSKRDAIFSPLGGEERPVVVGDAAGPEDPYPVRFSGMVVRGEGRSNTDTGLPTANLSGVRAELKSGLNGVYFGWVAIRESKTIVSDEWRRALVFARPAAGVPGISPKKKIQLYVIEDFSGVDFYDAKLSVVIMGFLRPWAAYDSNRFAEETVLDIAIANQSLERDAWAAETTLMRVRTNTTLSDRCVSARQFGQRQIDRIPFDKLAVRAPCVALRDGALGKGGLIVDRRTIECSPSYAGSANLS